MPDDNFFLQCSADEEVRLLAKNGELEEALNVGKTVLQGPRAMTSVTPAATGIAPLTDLLLTCYMQLLLRHASAEHQQDMVADFEYV